MNQGQFVISLDFEMFWGVWNITTRERYGNQVMNVHQVIPRLLELFEAYEVQATFATVGMVFFESMEHLRRGLPNLRPNYRDSGLSLYHTYLDQIATDGSEDLLHFAPDLVKRINQNHEVGTHTFSHYFCWEEGQTVDEFRADLAAAIQIADRSNISLTSIVFPRNQVEETYLSVCKEMGLSCYRSNGGSPLFARANGWRRKWLRLLRLLDAYVRLPGTDNCYDVRAKQQSVLTDIPASRFLRPYSPALRLLEPLRLRRIRKEMTQAAQQHKLYHLWWHPHNFGRDEHQNFQFLEQILAHYVYLNKRYGFRSYTMTGLAEHLKNG